MSDYTKVNLTDVKDVAPEYGMGDYGEARFARETVGAQTIGAAYHRVNGGRRLGFGHRHEADEEMYLVLSGSGRFKLGDDVIDVAARDLVFVPATTMRAWEAGPDGMELIAFGSHGRGDSEQDAAFWGE